jgi:hypothetical protein
MNEEPVPEVRMSGCEGKKDFVDLSDRLFRFIIPDRFSRKSGVLAWVIG